MVVFEGVVGRDYHSDIAIDDVLFQSGACATNNTQAQTFTCTTSVLLQL
jgi:hypothetical protein